MSVVAQQIKNAKIGALVWIDTSELTALNIESIKQDLRVQPRTNSANTEKNAEGKTVTVIPEPIEPWVIRGKYIGVPIAYGLRYLGNVFAQDRTSLVEGIRYDKLPDPNHPNAAPHQAEFFGDVFNAVVCNDAALVQGGTGTGKTVTILNTIARLQTTALVIVPSKALARQWVEECMRHLGCKRGEIGLLQGAKRDWQGKKIVICIIHNLVQKTFPREFYTYFGMVAWDECLPAGTMVGGKPIEHIKVGDYVPSMSGDGVVELRRVTHVWKRPIRHSLLKVTTASGKTVVCTENHLFWTNNGYIAAKDLRPRYVLAKLPYGKTKRTTWGMQGMPDTRGCNHPQRKKCFLQGCNLLLQRAWRAVSQGSMAVEYAEGSCRQYGSDQEADAGEQPYAQSRDAEQSQQHTQSYESQTAYSWRERNGDVRASEKPTKATTRWVGSRAFGRDWQGRLKGWILHTLQTGLSISRKAFSSRDRWSLSLFPVSTKAGFEERHIYEVDRVETVESIERGSDGGYTKDCPDGFVYDLEVDANHNFFANGILVHNCHNLGAREFSKTMHLIPAHYKLAVSATPYRKDGCDKLFTNYFGEVVVKAKGKVLSTTCFVAEYSVIGNVDWIAQCKSDSRPMKWMASLIDRNKLIVDIAHSLYKGKRNILILTKLIDHAELLIKLLVDAGIPKDVIGQFTGSYTVGSGKSAKRRAFGAAYLEKVKSESQIIVGTYSMLKEGVDIPRMDAGIEAIPTADAVQACGRVRRPFPNKPQPLWFSILDKRIPRMVAYHKAKVRGLERENVKFQNLDITTL